MKHSISVGKQSLFLNLKITDYVLVSLFPKLLLGLRSSLGEVCVFRVHWASHGPGITVTISD